MSGIGAKQLTEGLRQVLEGMTTEYRMCGEISAAVGMASNRASSRLSNLRRLECVESTMRINHRMFWRITERGVKVLSGEIVLDCRPASVKGELTENQIQTLRVLAPGTRMTCAAISSQLEILTSPTSARLQGLRRWGLCDHSPSAPKGQKREWWITSRGQDALSGKIVRFAVQDSEADRLNDLEDARKRYQAIHQPHIERQRIMGVPECEMELP